MTDRKRPEPPPRNQVSELIASMDGARIPGGCASCDAYQTVHANADGPGLHRVTVHHDEWCPWLNARRGARP